MPRLGTEPELLPPQHLLVHPCGVGVVRVVGVARVVRVVRVARVVGVFHVVGVLHVVLDRVVFEFPPRYCVVLRRLLACLPLVLWLEHHQQAWAAVLQLWCQRPWQLLALVCYRRHRLPEGRRYSHRIGSW
jgi:hypothetical protein